MPLPICSEPKYQDQMSKFLKDWPLSRVRTMPLSDYARVNKDDDSFRGSFCYALEQETPIGIGGGNAMKFGIYEFRRPSRMAKALQDDRYAWDTELGKTAEEAFTVLRARIVAAIESSQAGEYGKLDAIILPSVLKWKIAFLYQNPDKPGIVGSASESALRKYFKDSVPDADSLPISKLHALAIEKGPAKPCVHRIGWAIWDAVNPQRNYWNYTYDFEGETDDGFNDLPTLLAAGEIRCDWDTGESLAGLSTAEDEGKQQAAALLMAASEESAAGGTQAAEEELKKRPALNFLKMGLQIGDEISFLADPSQKAIITGERTVRFAGAETSLSDATRQLLDLSYNVAPASRWNHRGRKLSELYEAAYPRKVPTQTALMCWLFAKHMRPGDLVFARKAKTQDYVAGLVVSDYRYESSRERFRHVRSVRWLTQTPVAVPEVSYLITKALTDITKFPNETAILVKALNIDMSKLPDPTPPEPQAATPGKPTNVILYGPPGTGKTFHTKEHAVTLCNGKANPASLKEDFAKLVADKRVAFVTFHQSYDYSDFIIGFKPVPSASGMSFEVRKGVLMRLAEEAEKNQHMPYLLIIDEINRGNIPKIFGELITLIEKDKRGLTVRLPQSGTDFAVPPNVYIIGTMNTADRSIHLLDTALRRRFAFIELLPDSELLEGATAGALQLDLFLDSLNANIRKRVGREKQVGHAMFLSGGKPIDSAEAFAAIFRFELLPLLQEYLYDDYRELETLLGPIIDAEEQRVSALADDPETLCLSLANHLSAATST